MHRPSAEEFLLTLLETLDELPPDLAQRFAAVLKKDRYRPIRGNPSAVRGCGR